MCLKSVEDREIDSRQKILFDALMLFDREVDTEQKTEMVFETLENHLSTTLDDRIEFRKYASP